MPCQKLAKAVPLLRPAAANNRGGCTVIEDAHRRFCIRCRAGSLWRWWWGPGNGITDGHLGHDCAVVTYRRKRKSSF